jgi:hypothetical protein
MSTDTYIQLAPDAGGKKVKNLLLKGVPQSDGTYADVYIQCNAIVDQDGRAIDNDELLSVMKSIHNELIAIRQGIGELADDADMAFGNNEDNNDDDEDEIG